MSLQAISALELKFLRPLLIKQPMYLRVISVDNWPRDWTAWKYSQRAADRESYVVHIFKRDQEYRVDSFTLWRAYIVDPNELDDASQMLDPRALCCFAEGAPRNHRPIELKEKEIVNLDTPLRDMVGPCYLQEIVEAAAQYLELHETLTPVLFSRDLVDEVLGFTHGYFHSMCKDEPAFRHGVTYHCCWHMGVPALCDPEFYPAPADFRGRETKLVVMTDKVFWQSRWQARERKSRGKFEERNEESEQEENGRKQHPTCVGDVTRKVSLRAGGISSHPCRHYHHRGNAELPASFPNVCGQMFVVLQPELNTV